MDPTIEQFAEVRKIDMGPMVGKVTMSTHEDGSTVEPGMRVVMQRGDLTPAYTVAGSETLASIVEHPEAIAHADGHRRIGGNCNRAFGVPLGPLLGM
ncbi:hypothetical protein [Streptomyces sp. ME109]|uniref:hypothetical protein n=1 Tax=Streptomyces sp. me109 TaxID=1827853 RepID=UPI0011CE66A9|nr:hypothetical protein [Streptomyces sp. me109]